MQLADSIHLCIYIPACGRADMWLFGPRLVAISVLAIGMQLRQAGSMWLGGGGGGGKYHLAETGNWHVAEAGR